MTLEVAESTAESSFKTDVAADLQVGSVCGPEGPRLRRVRFETCPQSSRDTTAACCSFPVGSVAVLNRQKSSAHGDVRRRSGGFSDSIQSATTWATSSAV